MIIGLPSFYVLLALELRPRGVTDLQCGTQYTTRSYTAPRATEILHYHKQLANITLDEIFDLAAVVSSKNIVKNICTGIEGSARSKTPVAASKWGSRRRATEWLGPLSVTNLDHVQAVKAVQVAEGRRHDCSTRGQNAQEEPGQL